MKGLFLKDGALQLRRDLPLPTPAVGEALVRVLRAGICNTDLELVKGYYPFVGILGHEFVGVVQEGAASWNGRRVVGEINAVCGNCAACLHGRRSHCSKRSVLGIVGRDGAFAEYLLLPEENLHRGPDELSTDAATFVEPLAAALQIQEQVDVDSADRVLVVGDGKLGQLVAQTLALTGAKLLVIGRHHHKLARLRRRGIATGLEADVVAGSFDIAVECTGNAEGFALARRALRARGTLVMKSTYAGSLQIDASALVVDEIHLIGSRCGPFAPALALLSAGAVDVLSLLEERFPLERGVEAFARAGERGAMKVLLDIGVEK